MVPPDVPGPEECEPRSLRYPGTESIMNRLDVRLATARAWEDIDGNPVPRAARRCGPACPTCSTCRRGRRWRSSATTCPSASARRSACWAGNSLDNTLRVYRLVPTEWVLLDIRIQAVARGFGHGVVHQWAEDGTLMATASQSTIVRTAPPG